MLCGVPDLGAAIAFYVIAFSNQGVDLQLDAISQLSFRDDESLQTLGSNPVPRSCGPCSPIAGMALPLPSTKAFSVDAAHSVGAHGQRFFARPALINGFRMRCCVLACATLGSWGPPGPG